MPILTLIAGPNGAGKSTHSKDFIAHSGIEAFDFDKEFYSIWSQFSFDPAIEQGAFNRAQQLYLERRAEALQQHYSFAFETNYHTKEIYPILDMFKDAGYKLELIFICLESISLAIDRVKERVSKGGHFVEEDVIRERFKNGLILLDESFDRFDTVSIFLSKWKQVESLVIIEPALKSVISFNRIPDTIKTQLKNINEFIANHID